MGEVVKHGLFGVLHRSPARALHVSCRSACSRTAARAVVALHVAGILLTVILALGVHVNLAASAPRGLYRTVAGGPTRGAWVVACVSPQSAAHARARGYLGPGRCAGGNAAEAARLLGRVGRGSAPDPGGTVRAMLRRLKPRSRPSDRR